MCFQGAVKTWERFVYGTLFNATKFYGCFPDSLIINIIEETHQKKRAVKTQTKDCKVEKNKSEDEREITKSKFIYLVSRQPFLHTRQLNTH